MDEALAVCSEVSFSLSLFLSVSLSLFLSFSLSLFLSLSPLSHTHTALFVYACLSAQYGYDRVAWAPGALAEWKRSFWRVVTAADVVDALHASLIESDEVRVSQLCRDLERRKVHPWIVDRVGRRLEKLVLSVSAASRKGEFIYLIF